MARRQGVLDEHTWEGVTLKDGTFSKNCVVCRITEKSYIRTGAPCSQPPVNMSEFIGGSYDFYGAIEKPLIKGDRAFRRIQIKLDDHIIEVRWYDNPLYDRSSRTSQNTFFKVSAPSEGEEEEEFYGCAKTLLRDFFEESIAVVRVNHTKLKTGERYRDCSDIDGWDIYQDSHIWFTFGIANRENKRLIAPVVCEINYPPGFAPPSWKLDTTDLRAALEEAEEDPF